MHRLVLLIAFVLLGCTISSSHSQEDRPKELAGRWVLQHPDGDWGDTTTFTLSGAILGSTGHPIPPDATWGVRVNDGAALGLCIRGGGEANCQPYRLSADTLIWGTGSQADRFRRIGEPN